MAEFASGSADEAPPDIVATDNAVSRAGLAWDTAITASTIVTLISATNSARGVNRRIKRPCTDLTSTASPEAQAARRRRPQPVRLVASSLPGLVAASRPDQPGNGEK
jgi:hypothetical protein